MEFNDSTYMRGSKEENLIKILFVIPPLNRAGAQMLVLDICKKLRSDTYKNRVCVPTKDKGALAKEFLKIGIPVDSVVSKPLALFPIQLLRYLRKTEPDILHIHDIPALAPIIIVIGRLVGIKRIAYSIHGVWKFYSWKKLIIKNSWKVANSSVKVFLPVSRFVQSFWEKEYAIPSSKVALLYNGIDLCKFELEQIDKKSASDLIDQGPVIGTVGSLTPKKGHKFLLQAAPMVLKEFPKARFIIVGEGELRERLEELSSKLGILHRVTFTGARSDIPQLLRKFNIFVFPSAWEKGQRIGEAFPIAILEAMAMERPVIASNFSGIPEVIDDGETGLLVPPANPEALAKAIIWVLKHPKEAEIMGKKGRKRVEQLFSISSTLKKLEQIYQWMMNEGGGTKGGS
jgi:glycosyltransferase involved in cell wall biosynthesis